MRQQPHYGSLLKHCRQLVSTAHNAHPATTTASHRLQNHWVANAFGPFQAVCFALDNSVGPGQDRHSSLLHRLPCGRLLAHHPSHFRRRSNELDVRSAAYFSKVRILAQQAVAGMDCVDISDLRGGDHGGHIQIALRRTRRSNADCLIRKTHMQRVPVRLAVHRDGPDAHLPARRNNSHRNLTTNSKKYYTKKAYTSLP